MSEPNLDAVIIGAGASGVLAALQIRRAIALVLAGALVWILAGCGSGQTPSADRAGGSAPVDSTSATRAVAWIRDYYRAINEHRYRDAYAHWERGGLASGKSFEDFQNGFAETERVEVTVGAPGQVEGAAGSRYVEVPVRIVARTRDGAQQHYSGIYTLRLSVVDGATPEQRTWHIYSAAIRRT